MREFARTHSTDQTLMRVQDACAEQFRWLSGREVLDGVLLRAVQIATTATRVNHGLGRRPLGWIVTGSVPAATVMQSAADAASITLTASSAVVLDMWVF